MSSLRIALASSLMLVLANGCSNNTQGASCTPGTVTTASAGCMGTQVCEPVVGGHPACFEPLLVEGHVLDAITMHPIAGARVLALDVNGAAVSSVVVTAMDGAYSLPVPAQRMDTMGLPAQQSITLRVSASGYQTFASAPRTALPIDLSTAIARSGREVVSGTVTEVVLVPRTGGSGITLSGNVGGADHAGVLVIAEQGTSAVATAISDRDGAFVLFDVPAGMTTISGYRSGLRITPLMLTAAAPGRDGLALMIEQGALGTITGSINIVNAPGASPTTSVILVIESTFVADAARGEAPAGLRAANVSGSFTINQVPPGTYVVLAAFENDGLVRDPDTSIGGTTIQHVTVPPAGGTIAIPAAFKVTGALDVISPGASSVDTVTTAMPVFTWADDSSEDGYEVRVFDAFGNMVFSNPMLPNHTGGGHVTYTYAGPALTAGMLYQFRALSWRAGHGTTTAHVYISATEDLRGVFIYRP